MWRLGVGHWGFKVAKTKALISIAVTAILICVFVFAYMRNVGFLMTWLKSFSALLFLTS